jgi:hypothetical protein
MADVYLNSEWDASSFCSSRNDPKNLKEGMVVFGSVFIAGTTRCCDLPRDLIVSGRVVIRAGDLETLPAGWVIGGDLLINSGNFKKLSVKTKVYGTIRLIESGIREFPAIFRAGDIEICRGSRVKKIADSLRCKALFINKDDIEIGNDITATSLTIRGSSKVSIGYGLLVRKKVSISDSGIIRFGNNLKCCWLDIRNSKVRTMPEYAWLHTFELHASEIKSLPRLRLVRKIVIRGDSCLNYLDNIAIAKNCGAEKRSIFAFLDAYGDPVLSIGCFLGSEKAAIEAINDKYGDTKEGDIYKNSVRKCVRRLTNKEGK